VTRRRNGEVLNLAITNTRPRTPDQHSGRVAPEHGGRCCQPEAFFSGLQRELLDQLHWISRAQLATAIFEWIECWYNPHRRHSYCGGLSPIDYESANAA
jgi:transposase InsO family protein